MVRSPNPTPLTLSLIASLAGSAAPAYAADVVTVWYGARSASAKANWLYGDDSCKPGDRDCNVCAVTVREQFDDALREGKVS